ncbi:Cupin superfamily (DUF985) [Paenibacillus taihuensis]|uniref:Cupin superfamily (DUF985) n=1 Tax=Paenibacillus taihuensis TaxID=1156355 RepID=A0A3D9RMW8_9BACL|nr:Cupin superfamily (DUF985) [Paenibacillus taihuensis]
MITKQLSPLVQQLDLEPHPEGGWYRELWKASFEIPQAVLGDRYSGNRAAATSIYFVLHPDEVSDWKFCLVEKCVIRLDRPFSLVFLAFLFLTHHFLCNNTIFF